MASWDKDCLVELDSLLESLPGNLEIVSKLQNIVLTHSADIVFHNDRVFLVERSSRLGVNYFFFELKESRIAFLDVECLVDQTFGVQKLSEALVSILVWLHHISLIIRSDVPNDLGILSRSSSQNIDGCVDCAHRDFGQLDIVCSFNEGFSQPVD